MRIWITKYALTSGIESHDNAEIHDVADMVSYGDIGYGFKYAHGEGKEWHRSEESAISRAESMRISKIASLEKSILKLKKLVFKPSAKVKQ